MSGSRDAGNNREARKFSLSSIIPWWLFLFIMAHFAHHIMVSLLTPLLPYVRDAFSLNYEESARIISVFTLAYGFSHLPAGWLIDVIDPRFLITIGISAVAAFGLLFAVSPNYPQLLVASLLMGIASGGYHPASAPMVSASIEPARRGWALGLHQIGGTASHFLSPIIAVGLAGILGWRRSFFGLGIPAIVFGVALFSILGRLGYKKKTETVGHENTGETRTLEKSAPGSWKRLTAFLVLTVVGYSLIIGVINMLTLYLVDRYHVEKSLAAVLLSIVYSAGLWAGPLGGYLSDKLGSVPVVLVGSLLAGPIIYSLSFVPQWGTYLVMVGIGMVLYVRMPVSEAYLITRASGKMRGKLLGIYYFGSRGGPSVTTWAAGYIIQRYGFNTNFAVTAVVMAAVTLICGIFLLGKQD